MKTELNQPKGEAVFKRKKTRLSPPQRKKQRQLKQKLISTGGIVVLVVIFLFCIIFLVQRYYISKLDNEVTALQQEYDDIKGLNDSKEGKIVEKLGYAQIQAMAEGYGMRSPSEDQLVTESVTPQVIDESGWTQTKWYHRLIQ